MVGTTWLSKQSGARKKGTSIAELQGIFNNNITTKYIFEPLQCCHIDDSPLEVKEILDRNGFDTVGIIDDKKEKVGYVVGDELGPGTIQTYLRGFDHDTLISDSTPLADLFEILLDREYVYVLSHQYVEGIVTRADLNKPIVRIYLFGMISLFEMHLNFWITDYHKEESWKNGLTSARIKSAEEMYTDRKGKNEELSLLECLQICDKRDILKNTTKFIEDFGYSKNGFEKHLKSAEKIRNEIAHSQNSVFANLSWPRFLDTINAILDFLVQSEKRIEDTISTGKK